MNQRPAIGFAFVLILVGVFFLLSNAGAFDDLDLDIEQLWPAIVVLAGLAFLLQYLAGGWRDPGLVFVGTAATLLGLFFFLFTLNVELPWEFETLRGPIDWEDSEVLWPAFPIIGGIAFVMLATFGRDRGALGVGLVAIAVGVIAFPYTLSSGKEWEEIAQYWPVLLILAGGWQLLRLLFRRHLR
jgi:hypothetical protein